LKKEAYNQCFPFSFVVPEVWRFFQIFSIFFSNLHFLKKKGKFAMCFVTSDATLPQKNQWLEYIVSKHLSQGFIFIFWFNFVT